MFSFARRKRFWASQIQDLVRIGEFQVYLDSESNELCGHQMQLKLKSSGWTFL